MALFLFFEPLFQRLHDLVPVSEGLDRFHFLRREEFLGDGLQPVFGDVDRVLAVIGHYALEHLLEHLIEAIQQALILHEGRAGEVVEGFRRLIDHVTIKRLQQREMLLEGSADPGGPQLVDEVEEHGRLINPRGWA